MVWHLSHSSSPCMYVFSPPLLLHPSFMHIHCILYSLSPFALCASFLAILWSGTLIQLANYTIITQIKTINSFLQCSFISCLSSTSYRLTLCFKANYSLSKYAIEKRIRSSKTISKLINNCQVRGKAERA